MTARALVVLALVGCGGGSAVAIDAAVPPADAALPSVVRVFDHVPQFGIYVYRDPTDYTPPDGLVMWTYGTEWVTRLTDAQQAAIGADVAAEITYHAQCDNYDRLGGLFVVTTAKGATPAVTDPRIELVRFITPFSDYQRGARATHVYPDVDLSAYAAVLADPTHDVWLGIAGGSNPYDGDPCTGTGVAPSFAEVGFLYSVDLVSHQPRPAAGGTTLVAVSAPGATATPVTGTFTNPGGELHGHVTVIVSGHGSSAGGDEYRHTMDTVRVGDAAVGRFDTTIDCAPYRDASPDGNPGIFVGNAGGNPRNWCPGALVPPHTFPLVLPAGATTASLEIDPGDVPSGSYYATSIVFSAP